MPPELIIYIAGALVTQFAMLAYDPELGDDPPILIMFGFLWPLVVALGLLAASLWPAVRLGRWLRSEGTSRAD